MNDCSSLMNFSISICIPTCHRADLVSEAIHSCLAQSLLPTEIIIGDDSTDSRTEELITSVRATCPLPIVYMHHSPPLGQAENVNRLFDAASGDKLVLLHDDDLLLPDALETLARCFQQTPAIDAAFGKQYVVSHSGEIRYEQSESLNRTFWRTAAFEGSRITALESALVQQFPNDGYMINTAAARAIRYRPKQEVGTACDFDFGFRLGKVSGAFYFIDKYLVKYRLSRFSVSGTITNDACFYSYKLVRESQVPAQSIHLKNQWMNENKPMAIKQAAITGHKRFALKLYFEKESHAIQQYISLRRLQLLVMILTPAQVLISVHGYIKLLKKILST